MEVIMAIFLVVSSLGFYNSNTFKNFLKYKFKIWNIYSNLYNFEKIHQKVQYLVKNELYNVDNI